MKKLSTKELTITGVMTAITCILGPIAIPLPFSPVPISFTVLAVYLSAYVLGMKLAACTYICYLLLGMAGLPVFSGFSGGLGKIAGPTGGYLVGFIFMTLIVGWFIDHYNAKTLPALIGMTIGTILCYLFGTIWLSFSTQTPFIASLSLGVLPYIPGDIIKIIVALLIGKPIRRATHALFS